MLRPSTNGYVWCLRDALYEDNSDSFNNTLLINSTFTGMAFNIFYPFIYLTYLSFQFARFFSIRLFRLVMAPARGKPDLASNACLSCKTKKRRCDKNLPRCLECTKKKRRCNYDYVNKISPINSEQSDSYEENYLSVQSIICPPNPYTLPPSTFPALYFVDPSVFHNHHVELPRVSIPSYVAGELGSNQQQEQIGRLFFHTIHSWFPMVSRKRFYDDLHVSAEGFGPAGDLGFLLLAMKLMTWRPPSSEGDAPVVDPTARTATYRAAKQFGFELETAGVISLRVLQGMILVSLYEIGHAIYPAAFMSVAASVRYAQGLGIQPGGMQRLKLPLSWVEEEERKRVWWSAFLLDRLSGMTCPGCPAAIDEPRPEDPLPTDDALWDEGATKVPFSPLLKNPVSMEFGRFALLIQAFVLLSKVLRLVSSRDEQSHLLKDEAQQLERTVKALLYFGQMECKWRNGVPSCELHSISHISLITMYTSPKIPVEMPDNFIEPLADVLDSSNYEHMVTAARRGRDEISPFLIQILYLTSVQLLKRERPKNGGDWGETRVEKLKTALMWLDKRWQLAGVFHQALEAQQIALSRETSN